MMLSCLLLSSGMPLLWVLLPIYCSLCYWCDKLTFLRYSVKPPQYQHHLTSSFVWWLQVGVFMHCGFGVFVFGNPESIPSHGAEEFLTRTRFGNNTLEFIKNRQQG